MLVTAMMVARAFEFVLRSRRTRRARSGRRALSADSGAIEENPGQGLVAGKTTARGRLKSRTCSETKAGDLEKADLLKSETDAELRQPEKQNGLLVSRPPQFRVQFVGRRPDSDSSILKEVGIEATDVSSAIVAAAKETFPPKTTGLRILDREGREVFARTKAAR